MSHKNDTTACSGCIEYNDLSRRRFLGLSAGALAAAAIPAWMPRVALAQSENSERDVIVSIFLRGGADALTLCVPHGENAYYDLRPTISIPRPDSGSPNAVLDLDGFFGLAPAMSPLMDAWDDGALAIVHACGTGDPTRSHFNAMYFMEVGQPQPPASLFSGWLGRHLATTHPITADAPLRALGLGVGLPRTLAGAPSTLPIPDPETFGFGGDPLTVDARRSALNEMYSRAADELLKNAALNTQRTVDLLDQIDFASYRPAGQAEYPENEFGNALRSAAALIKAEVGVEAIAVDLGGWDTHDDQEPIEGQMAQVMRTLSEGLAAFHKDLFSDDFDNVIVTAMSEFGRNAFENGSLGTDHGHGGAMLILGGQVDGGRVISQWPGLAREQLYEGQDLAATIDYRDVLSEIVTRRLGNPDIRNVFPDESYSPHELGILRTVSPLSTALSR